MTSLDAHPAVRLLDELASERVEPLVPRSRVIDRLLDLRNSLSGDRVLVAVIDERLADVPGATLTSGAWWRQELLVLRELVGEVLAESEPCR